MKSRNEADAQAREMAAWLPSSMHEGDREPTRLQHHVMNTPVKLESGMAPAASGVFSPGRESGATSSGLAKLLSEQARLQAVIASISGGVLVEDERGHIVLANEAFHALFSLDRRAARLVGSRRSRLISRLAPQAAQPARFRERVATLLRHDEPSAGEEISMNDGRVLERDYVPLSVADGAAGRLWLFRDITERKARERELFRLATIDVLTGVNNRYYFIEKLSQEISRIRRFHKPASLLLADLDHFKRVNDAHGHAVGDAVLQHFVAIARSTLRVTDFIGRLGGEEFAIFLPGSDTAGALETAERVRENLSDRPAKTSAGLIRVTVSVGITTVLADHVTPDIMLSRADQALYAAKASGRDRTASHPESPPASGQI